jgi:hypothetical protein
MSLPTDSKYVRLISSRLRNFKQKKDYLWNFSCPFCGDSQKNKTKARGYAFQKVTIFSIAVTIVEYLRMSVISSNRSMIHYTRSMFSSDTDLVKPITPIAPTPSSISRHRDLIKWQNKKSSNTANGSAIYRVDIFV